MRNSLEWVKNIVDRISYKPGVSFHTYWVPNQDTVEVEIIIKFRGPDRDDFNREVMIGSVVWIDPNMISDEQCVILLIRNGLMDMETHELDEFFKLDGKRVSDPHA